MNTYVLYHANCADGFGAAWAAHLALSGKCHLIPVSYGSPLPPDIPDGSRVYILDFSYSQEIMDALAQRCTLTVIDHHETSEEALKGRAYGVWERYRSGAVLTWKFFNGDGPPVPKLLSYVEDRDLWSWLLPNSREISAGIAACPFDLRLWTNWVLNWTHAEAELLLTGRAMLAAQKKRLVRAVEAAQLLAVPFGEETLHLPAVNASCDQSEIGETLLQVWPESPAAVIFWQVRGKWVYSLRSRKSGFNCAALAQAYGGGGHQAAAGFSRLMPPLPDFADVLPFPQDGFHFVPERKEAADGMA